MTPPLTLVLLAAGRSTRYGKPKQVAPLGPTGASLTVYTIVDALRAGFTRVVLVTNRALHPLLEAHVREQLGGDAPVDWALQELDAIPAPLAHLAATRSKPWGTAQAILAAAPRVDGPFAVANADDWYGPEAFEALAERLLELQKPPGTGSECLGLTVGYPMEVTLSPFGGVSRGWLIADEGGRVERVVELREVRRAGFDLMVGVDPEGRPAQVASGTPASMNLWGFHPCIFELLEEAFEEFLETEGADGFSEFALSNAVDIFLAAGTLRLSLLPAGQRWFGVTHPGDTEAVSARLEALHEEGTYSIPLVNSPG